MYSPSVDNDGHGDKHAATSGDRTQVLHPFVPLRGLLELVQGALDVETMDKKEIYNIVNFSYENTWRRNFQG